LTGDGDAALQRRQVAAQGNIVDCGDTDDDGTGLYLSRSSTPAFLKKVASMQPPAGSTPRRLVMMVSNAPGINVMTPSFRYLCIFLPSFF
jgi:hypothetical protein